jgi:inorganic pyrophosphatase
MTRKTLATLPAFDRNSGDAFTVVETPKGSHNKYAYSEELEAFELRKVLPRGMSFPYNFGFIPSTRADDGDPLDILLLMDASTPSGCVVRTRIIGAIEAEESEDGKKWVRNSRLIGVATHAHHGNVEALKELNPEVLDEIEGFFEQYNRLEGKQFRPIDRVGPKRAMMLIKEAQASSTDAKKSG